MKRQAAQTASRADGQEVEVSTENVLFIVYYSLAQQDTEIEYQYPRWSQRRVQQGSSGSRPDEEHQGSTGAVTACSVDLSAASYSQLNLSQVAPEGAASLVNGI